MAKAPQRGHGPWSHEALLLAAQIDTLRAVLYVLVRTAGGKPAEPTPWPRPGVVAGGGKRKALTAEGSAYLRRMREEHARIHGYAESGTGEVG